jgi:AraC-like DNA-binding protein
MLANNRDICETATELGFASDLGLRREFIKHFGLTPERYVQAAG